MSVPVAAEKLEAAQQMLGEGASQLEVARALGMTTKTVRKYFPRSAKLPAPTVDYEAIARLHQQGLTSTEIATRVGCNPRSVQRWRAAQGVSEFRGGAFRPVTPERLSAARSMLDDGASQMDVSRTLGMSRQTLRKHLPGRGWTQQQAGSYAVMVRRLNCLESFAMKARS